MELIRTNSTLRLQELTGNVCYMLHMYPNHTYMTIHRSRTGFKTLPLNWFHTAQFKRRDDLP